MNIYVKLIFVYELNNKKGKIDVRISNIILPILPKSNRQFFRALFLIGRDDNTKNVPSKRKEQEAILRLTGKTTVN